KDVAEGGTSTMPRRSWHWRHCTKATYGTSIGIRHCIIEINDLPIFRAHSDGATWWAECGSIRWITDEEYYSNAMQYVTRQRATKEPGRPRPEILDATLDLNC